MAIFDSISNFVNDGLSSFGLDGSAITNYVKSQLPIINDGTERTKMLNPPSGYIVALHYKGENIGEGIIKANMPKQINIELSSSWQPMQDDTSSPHKYVDTATAAFNGTIYTKNQNLSIMRWTGTTPLKLTLNLDFIANNRSEVRTKIYDPIIALTKLVLPQVSSAGFYTPPGPHYSFDLKEFRADKTGGTTVDIRIGDYMMLNNVVIQQARINLPSILGNISSSPLLEVFNSDSLEDGIKNLAKDATNYFLNGSSSTNMNLAPMRASVSIGISTSEAMTANSIEKMFNSLQISSAPDPELSGILGTVKNMFF